MYYFTKDDEIAGEEWRVINAHPSYEVSNLGRVRHNTNKGTLLLKPYDNNYGYLVLRLDGQYALVHRLVAEAFIENPEGKKCVDHIDADRYNCISCNLRWATHKENSNYVKEKYKPKDIYNCQPVKCVETGEIFESHKAAADWLNVTKTMIWYALKNENHTAKGYHFELAECQPENEYIHFLNE